MANEFNITYIPGLGASAMYATVHNQAGQVWNKNASLFEIWDPAEELNGYYGHTGISEYGPGSGIYVGGIDGTFSSADEGRYIVKIYLSSSDDLIGSDFLYWNGTAEISQTESDLTLASITEPSGVATNPWEMITQLWMRFFRKVTKSSSTNKITVFDTTDTAVTEQTIVEGALEEEVGKATDAGA